MTLLESPVRPILVTGSHRSGTTWTGKTLALAPDVGYIKEPFRPNGRPGICRTDFPYWFQYVCDENGSSYEDGLQRTLRFDYALAAEARSLRSPKDLARMGRDYLSFQTSAWGKKRPLMKDPIALFSAQWLADTFDMDVIVLIRHPAAFASSLMRKGFRHPFADFLAQPLLMRDFLSPFQAEIEQHVQHQRSILEEAALLWRMIYATVLQYRRERPAWIYARHEDLSREPEARFRELYSRLGLDYTPHIEAVIRRQTNSSNHGQAADPGDRYQLDSAANSTSWMKRLTRDEILFIRRDTEDVSCHFYMDDDWELSTS